MFQIYQNEPDAQRRRIMIVLEASGVDSIEDIEFISSDALVIKSTASQAFWAGTFTTKYNGRYIYEFTQGEVNAIGYLSFTVWTSITKFFHIMVQILPPPPYEEVSIYSGSTTTVINIAPPNGTVDNFYAGSVISFSYPYALYPLARKIVSSNATDNSVTVSPALPAAPANNSKAIIIGRID